MSTMEHSQWTALVFGGAIVFGFVFGLREMRWVGCRGVRGLRGAREAWGRRGGGVLEAQVFTYKWNSKQYTVGSNVPY